MPKVFDVSGENRGLGFRFESPIVERFTKFLPQFRGASLFGSFVLKIAPISQLAFLEFNEAACEFDLTYRTQFAFARSQFEMPEFLMLTKILQPGDCFFDVGGNWGFYTFLASTIVGAKGLVVTMEANPAAFSRLRKTATGNVLPFPFAVSNKTDDRVEISKALRFDDTSGFISRVRNSRTRRDFVRTRTLDQIWSQIGRPSVKMVKIDTEGAEPLVLTGGTQFFQEETLRAALIEVGPYTSRFGYDPICIFDYMKDFGFSHIYAANPKMTPIEMSGVVANSVPVGNLLFTKGEFVL